MASSSRSAERRCSCRWSRARYCRRRARRAEATPRCSVSRIDRPLQQDDIGQLRQGGLRRRRTQAGPVGRQDDEGQVRPGGLALDLAHERLQVRADQGLLGHHDRTRPL